MTTNGPSAPQAKRVPHERIHHGDVFVDDYEWLRDKSDPEVIAHLNAENGYTDAVLAPQQELRDRIFAEIKGRTKETDLSIPVRDKDWWYYARTVEGQQYGISCRAPYREGDSRPVPTPEASLPGEQVLLDGNVEAEGKDFYSVGGLALSPDQNRLAALMDFEGDERYKISVRTIPTGEVLEESVTGVGYGLVWAADGESYYYTRVDEAWRPFQVWHHVVGEDPSADTLLFTEEDASYWLGIGGTHDDRWLVLSLGSKDTAEFHLLDLQDVEAGLRVVQPRTPGLDYDIEIDGQRLYIVHNRDRVDYDVSWAPLATPGIEHWQLLLEGGEGERLMGVSAFRDFVLVGLRSGGLATVKLLPKEGDGFGVLRDLPFSGELMSVGVGANPTYEATTLMVATESFVEPRSVYDWDTTTDEVTLLKRREVLGGHEPSDYQQHRLWATAPDGAQVPISLVAHKDVAADGTNPVLLYGYGSYESSIDPYFSVLRLSLLQRGVVFAIAHVRGGGEMGRSWYLDGRLEHKKNTFDDFVACGRHLVDTGWASPDRLAAEGGSAGGLLIGAVINEAPDLFCAVVTQVPFVDALTTTLDPSMPLTQGEWEEWGNPLADAEVYAYMKSYAPYENVRAERYPAVLATTSLNDTRVFFVEPAKWVQQLRRTVTSDQSERPILLKTEMVAGHGGVSGRYESWKEAAFETAYLLDRLGATQIVYGG
ncbi:protease 2 [Dermacoccus sp. PE3]|uniref:S9 family peptidase n=1 Tax=Dermacoccus sp. PE3 TaxID=1641401 RepID=UPI000641B7C2|nr:S9 family peptidase [Dermacoccus sp. PE3]KLO63039.1 protease 2 [Dermacoccus sp. PE3]